MPLELNLKEYEFMLRLSDISRSIKVIYDELSKLEIDGKINTEEYQKQLKYLDIAKEVEDDIYKDLQGIDLNNILLYLILKDLDGEYSQDFSDITYTQIDNFKVKRIINKIIDKKLYSSEIDIVFLSILYSVITMLKDNYDESIDLLLLKKYMICEIQAQIDISKLTLSFINERKNADRNIQRELEKVKYNLAYINPEIEKYLLENSFQIEDRPLFTSNFITDMADIDRSFFRRMKYLISREISSQILQEVLALKEEDYKSLKLSTAALINLNFLRAAAVYLPLTDLSDLLKDNQDLMLEELGYNTNSKENEEVEENDKNKETEIISPFSNTSLDLIVEAYDNFISDKEKYMGIKLVISANKQK